jgi:hypothetical protein
VLRIAYRRGTEAETLARSRIDAVAARARTLWQAQRKQDKGKPEKGKDPDEDAPRNPLIIETELIETVLGGAK